MRKLLATKLERMTYLVIVMWIVMGCICVGYDRNFADLAVYFVSLSGFAGAYVFAEIKRPSDESALFLKKTSSSREKMMYWVIIIWFFLGCIGLAQDLALQNMGAYFASLTPFVSAYIIGQTYKPEVPIIKDDVVETSEVVDDGESDDANDGENTDLTAKSKAAPSENDGESDAKNDGVNSDKESS